LNMQRQVLFGRIRLEAYGAAIAVGGSFANKRLSNSKIARGLR